MKTRLFHAFFWTLLPAGLLFSSVFSQAEALCPGRAQGLHPRLVAHALLVVSVKINQAGPFDFMLDTGSQLNVIDPELAAQLAVKPQAQVGLVTTSSVLPASVVAPSIQSKLARYESQSRWPLFMTSDRFRQQIRASGEYLGRISSPTLTC